MVDLAMLSEQWLAQLLLSAVLSLPSPAAPASQDQGTSRAAGLAGRGLSPCVAPVRRARPVPEAVLGVAHDQPQPLAVVPIDDHGHAPGQVRAAQAFFRMAEAARRAGIYRSAAASPRTKSRPCCSISIGVGGGRWPRVRGTRTTRAGMPWI